MLEDILELRTWTFYFAYIAILIWFLTGDIHKLQLSNIDADISVVSSSHLLHCLPRDKVNCLYAVFI